MTRLLACLPLPLAALTACGGEGGRSTTWPDVALFAALWAGIALVVFAATRGGR